eukprot:CAMPEP_0174705354 /NCGR_PEP_ID=MMETSP1094-20130205/8616_1 /TAXON_ID=156173 /ORGANISM="Chrysochromulina brevifilum, Strain UTEX LB 985" /LENGTH=142 /DNA_ID=CAMNT_0015903511 /DNA_START=40 /DNA_END=465 /DNA_ORIENTATION=-
MDQGAKNRDECRSILQGAGVPLDSLATADLSELGEYPDSDEEDVGAVPCPGHDETMSWSASGGQRDASFRQKLPERVAKMTMMMASSSSFASTLPPGEGHRPLGADPGSMLTGAAIGTGAYLSFEDTRPKFVQAASSRRSKR